VADNIEKLILDDTGFINPLNDSIKKMEEAEKAFKELNSAQMQGSQKVANEIKKSSEVQGKAVDDVKKKQVELRKAHIESAKETKLFGYSLNDVTGKINEYKARLQGSLGVVKNSVALSETQTEGVKTLTDALGGGAKAWTFMAKGVNIFKAALIATGIGALIVALGGLVSFLTSTQKGMDLVSQKTAYLGGAFDVLKGKVSEVGNSIVESFSNGTVIQDFGNLLTSQISNRVTGLIDVFKNLWSVVSGGGKSLTDVGASLGQVVTGISAETIKETAKEMLEVAAAAEEIQKQLTALKREQAAYNVQFASTRAEIEKLKKIGDDTSKTFEDRTKAVVRGAALEQTINAKNIEFLRREIALVEKRTNLKGAENITDEDRQKGYDLRLKLADALNDSEGKQTELQNTLNGLIKEQKDLLMGIQENLIKVGREYATVSEFEEFNFVKNQQITQLELFRSKLIDVGKTLKQDVTPEIETLDKLLNAVKASGFKVDGIEKLGTTLERDIKKFTNQPIKINQKLQIIPEIDEDSLLEGIDSFDDLLNSTLEKIFGEDSPKGAAFLSGAASLINEFGSILNEATDIQLSNIDKQLDALSKRREKLQDDLAKELELQEKGLANNVGNKQGEVDGLLAEEERLMKEREKIQKEAAKRQLISDTIAQTQSLITSSINIIKGFSNIPFVGLPLGIAAVGALLAFFAKTKVDAFKATKLYTGADKISDHFGYGDRHGDTDLPGRGSGYRLINERTGKPTNVIISGKEMMLPEDVSLPNTEFFHSLKNGMYKGVDLNAAIGFYLNYKGKANRAHQSTVIQHQSKPQAKERARVAIPHTMKNGKKGMIITTIKADWTDGKFIEFDL